MKKKFLCLMLLLVCLFLTGCGERMDQDEIDRIGNLINGTGE